MLSGQGRATLRLVAARAFLLSTVKALAQQFAAPGDPARLAPALDPQPIQPALAGAATTFQELQQACHEAVYDLSRRFTRSEVLLMIDLSLQAFDDWQSVRGSMQADAFLAGLLTYSNIQG